METSHIREFIVMAEHCNYTSAADALFISQSSLYKHIKALEQEINAPLFEREGKQISISKFGQAFLPHAKKILSITRQYMGEIDSIRQDDANVLSIGAQYRVSGLVQEFRRKCSRYLLHVISGDTAEQMADRFNCELLFLRGEHVDPEKYESFLFVEESVAVVLYHSHPLAKRKSIRLEELRQENFILLSPKQSDKYELVPLCHEAGFMPKIVMNAELGSEVARLVSQEFGISLLFKQSISELLLGGVALVDLKPKIECPIYLCWQKNTPLSAGAKDFIEFAKDYSAQYSL